MMNCRLLFPASFLARRARHAVAVLAALLATLLAAPVPAQLRDGSDPAASPTWQKVRAGLFGDRPIEADPAAVDGVIGLEAPARAEHASTSRHRGTSGASGW
jgi:hypothetical protein